MKRQTKLEWFIPYVLGTCILIFTVGCGSDEDDEMSEPSQEEQQQEEGTYRASLTPLNSDITGAPNATVDIIISGDDVHVTVGATGAPTGRHMQNIFIGTECPTSADDANSDDIIDVVEGQAKYGNILIPLDGNLNSQSNGNNEFPSNSAAGNYVYDQTGSLSEMMGDLRATDPDPTDEFGKLASDENLNLAGRVVVIHGVSLTTDLPDTVGSFENESNRLTLPIACGVITRVAGEGIVKE